MIPSTASRRLTQTLGARTRVDQVTASPAGMASTTIQLPTSVKVANNQTHSGDEEDDPSVTPRQVEVDLQPLVGRRFGIQPRERRCPRTRNDRQDSSVKGDGVGQGIDSKAFGGIHPGSSASTRFGLGCHDET